MKKQIILFLLIFSTLLASAQHTHGKRSKAVEVALAHIQAWSNHDWDKAKRRLATDVHVTATTTQPIMKPTNLTGIDDYMAGLKLFAGAVVPGSAKILSTAGDDHNAMIMVTVKADFGGRKVLLTGARLYQLDSDFKIKTEQVVFFTIPN